MSAASETVVNPFTAFSFDVVLSLAAPVPGVGQPVCQGAFAECDGLQIDMEPKSVVQGGVTDAVTHLMGHTRAGQLTLRRGMTSTPDLWAWMAAAGVPGTQITADGQIKMIDGAGVVQARFLLTGCLPVRLRGPSLNAQTGLVAIEELGLAVGQLTLAGATPAAGSLFGARITAGASISVGTGFSAGAQVSGGLGLSGQLGGTFSGSASGAASAAAPASFGGGFGGGG
jgi:phage tail-like protein